MPAKGQSGYNCPEQERLTRIETQVQDTLIKVEIPAIKKKIDRLIRKLDNGLITKVNEAIGNQERMAHDISVLQDQVVQRPQDPETKEPVERRADPPKSFKQRWQELSPGKKVSVASVGLGIVFKQEIRDFLSTVLSAYIGQ
jgi:hypothetical protein